MLERPWGECNHGKALTQHGLAWKLKAFGIHPKNVKLGGKVPKAYMVADFEDAFSRYLPDPPFQTATTTTANEINGLYQKQTATSGMTVAVQNTPSL